MQLPVHRNEAKIRRWEKNGRSLFCHKILKELVRASIMSETADQLK